MDKLEKIKRVIKIGSRKFFENCKRSYFYIGRGALVVIMEEGKKDFIHYMQAEEIYKFVKGTKVFDEVHSVLKTYDSSKEFVLVACVIENNEQNFMLNIFSSEKGEIWQ